VGAGKFMRSILLLATFTLISMTAQAASPDPAANGMIAEFIKMGAKAYYMGEQNGLQGWLIIKDNEVQIGYAPPDNKSLLVGVLFDAQGNSISSQQIKNLYDTNKEANAALTAVNNQQLNVSGMPTQAAFSGAPGTPMANMGQPSFMPTTPPMPSSPGEQLMQALQNAAGVDVGSASAPKLFMVVDPNCPHCHEVWKELRAAVYGGKLQIRLVPIGAFGPESERASAQLLHVGNPLDVWDKYIAGDQNQLAGTPDAAAIAAIQANHALIDAWHIQMTPYLIYRAKSGQAKIVQGEPKQVGAVVDDIGP